MYTTYAIKTKHVVDGGNDNGVANDQSSVKNNMEFKAAKSTVDPIRKSISNMQYFFGNKLYPVNVFTFLFICSHHYWYLI